MTAGLRLIIDSEPNMHCAGCLETADRLGQAVREELRDSVNDEVLVVLLDATMPGKDSLAVVRELRISHPDARTIMYSGHDDAEFVERAAEAGAWGCVSKNADPLAVMLAVREVAGRARRAEECAGA